jgi:hypothetical protein
MARNLSEQPITGKDISQYLVDQDDFNLELRCLHACRQNNLSTTHGGTYTDPVTGKPRQFDLRASRSMEHYKIQLAIECKNLKPFFPLVVSRVPRQRHESFFEVVMSCEPEAESASGGLCVMDSFETLRISEPVPLYKDGEPVGKATTQLGKRKTGEFESGDAEVYEKWAQAVASADDLISEASTEHERNPKSPIFTLILPVLVVTDDTLWAVDYSADGAKMEEPKQVEECTFFLGKSSGGKALQPNYTLSHLHIYTFSGFLKFLPSLRSHDFFEDVFDKRAIRDAIRGKPTGQ